MPGATMNPDPTPSLGVCPRCGWSCSPQHAGGISGATCSLRRELGLSQTAFGKRLFLGQNTISRIETGVGTQTSNSSAISGAVRVMRQKMAITPEQFSGLFGVNRATVHRWEQGYKTPSFINLLILKKLAAEGELKAVFEDALMAIPALGMAMCEEVRAGSTPHQFGIGAAVRSLRVKLGMTQEALGNKIFLRHNTVSQIENGGYTPTPQVVFMLLQMAAQSSPEAASFRAHIAQYRHKHSMPEERVD